MHNAKLIGIFLFILLKKRRKMKWGRQVAGSRVCNEKDKEKVRHDQVSSSLSDKYMCGCGRAYARKQTLLNHIARENKKAKK